MNIYKTEQGYFIAEGKFLGRRYIIEGESWSEAFHSAVNYMRGIDCAESKAA